MIRAFFHGDPGFAKFWCVLKIMALLKDNIFLGFLKKCKYDFC